MIKKNKEPHLLYLIGIKGMAMTGLAIIAKNLGYEVVGSDVEEVFPTDEVLAAHDIKVLPGFAAEHVKATKPDLVIISAAFGSANPEVKAAKSARITCLAQSEMLGMLMKNFENIGVAGVHGKTTTSSLIAFILQEASFSPSYMIGTSAISGLDGNAHVGTGKYFVAEADEYKRSEEEMRSKFLDYPLQHVIVTSIELDHPDVFDSAESVFQAFYKLVTKLPRNGTVVACSDWPLVRRLVGRMADRTVLTYGLEAGATYQAVNITEGAVTTFSIKTDEEVMGPFTIQMPGMHNVLNSMAAIAMTRKLGVSIDVITKALAKFSNPQRRFEVLGEYKGVPVITDFAHHPTAVRYLLEAAKHRYPGKKIIAVFQPHTYSRTGKLLKEFADSLQNCDQLILLNIFASAREKSGYVTIKDLIDELRNIGKPVEYRSTLEEVAGFLKSQISPDQVILLIGAGDVYKIYKLLEQE